MKPPSAITLAPEEWDFRSIEDVALPDATLWEYARESEVLRTRIVAWLDSRINGKTTVRAFLKARRGRLLLKGERIADWGKEACIWDDIQRSGLTATLDFWLCELVKQYPQFPAPWVSLDTHYEPSPNETLDPLGFLRPWQRVSITPMAETLKDVANVAAIMKGEISELSVMENLTCETFQLRISWSGATKREILSGFGRWLQQEMNNHPECIRGGKPAQAKVDKLRWLAAYRLSKAGLSHKVAAEFLHSIVFPSSGASEDTRHLLPYYEGSAEWHGALKRARSELTRVAVGDPATLKKFYARLLP